MFKNAAAGAPYQVYSLGNDWSTRSYAVAPGDELEDLWPAESRYHFKVFGPNGFLREFRGTPTEQFDIEAEYERVEDKKASGNLLIKIVNNTGKPVSIQIRDRSYQQPSLTKKITSTATVLVNLSKSFGWYDLSVTIPGNKDVEVILSGRVETGRDSKSDPAMA